MEIKVVKNVLTVNNTIAAQNRQLFKDHQVFVINVMSSPGSGKTTLLEHTLTHLAKEVSTAVIVGDICTTNDSERLAKTGIPVIQINTDEFGGDCHLAAHVIQEACKSLDLNKISLLIVENVGNLVCPAEFDIGENARVVVLSVTEGEDKPLKYPIMFRVSDVAILNKIDLIPHLKYDIELTKKYIHQINPKIPMFELSAITEHGLDQWLNWLKSNVAN